MYPSPTVSVVLAVRNGGTDLPRALETILSQSFFDFELIVINDGSIDGTGDFLNGISDPRVRTYHQAGVGLANALNRGISLARGRYIARQDHDDWALPTRLAQQVAFLDANPDHAMVGTRAEIWIGDQPTGRFHDHPTDDAELRFFLLFNNPFVHSSVMIRKAALDKIGGYSVDPARQPPEDYELWSRVSRGFRTANLPDRLTVYREVPTSMSRAGAYPFNEKMVLISAENLAAATIGEPVPQRVHLDIACLLHSSPERMSQSADIKQMCAIISNAGAMIFGDSRSERENRIVEARKRNLRRQFMVHKCGLRPARNVVVGVVKKSLRRFPFLGV